MGRRDGHSPSSPTQRRRRDPQTWVVPALLSLLGIVVLILGRTSTCLSLADGTAGSPGGEVCTTSFAPGAIIFAGICLLTALIVWLAQRER